MADPTAAQTREATAQRVFMRKQKTRIWAGHLPFLQIMLTRNLTANRETNFGLMTKSEKTVAVAEDWMWPVEMLALPNGGAYARGGSYTFANKDQDVAAKERPKLYAQPVEYPSSDMDVFAEATKDSMNAINIMVNKKMSAAHQLGTLVNTDLLAAATAANGVTALNVGVDSTGIVNSIDPANQPLWASNEIDLLSNPLSIRRMRKDIGAHNRSRFARISLTVSGEGIGQTLQDDVEARNIPMINIVDLFGTAPGSNKAKFYLEQTIEAWKTVGAIHLIDPTMDAALSTTVFGLDLDNVMLVAAKRNNFSVVGPRNVELEAEKDATRQLLKTAIFKAYFNRRAQMKWVNVTS